MAASAFAEVREAVKWLGHIEERVGALYARAAALCCDDAPFQEFLSVLVADEKSHADAMSAVGERLDPTRPSASLDIVLDEAMRERVETILDRFDRFLSRSDISTKGVLEYVARAETCELNPVFLYIIDEFRESGREGQRIAGEIQKHLLRVQDFIDGLPRDMRPSVNIDVLPRVGEIRLLVVDNHAPLQGLLRAVLARRGTVDTAASGEEALARMREHFHEAVVSDLQIPDMDGLELHRRAVRHDAHLRANFLFYSARLAPREADYLKRNGLPFLQKPFPLTDFYKAVDRILWADGAARPEDS